MKNILSKRAWELLGENNKHTQICLKRSNKYPLMHPAPLPNATPPLSLPDPFGSPTPLPDSQTPAGHNPMQRIQENIYKQANNSQKLSIQKGNRSHTNMNKCILSCAGFSDSTWRRQNNICVLTLARSRCCKPTVLAPTRNNSAISDTKMETVIRYCCCPRSILLKYKDFTYAGLK